MTKGADLLEVSSVDFQRDSERYQDIALDRPVAVKREGRETTVLLSAAEYTRLKKRDRVVLGLDDFTDADLAALETSRPPQDSQAFDDELKP